MELTEIKEVTITQSGEQFIKDQAIMQIALERIEDQRKEIDRLNSQLLTLRLKLSTSNIHLFKFLDEKEAEFDNDERFVSPEICKDYIDAALYCQNYFDRTNNRITDAMAWYNSQDSLPFKTFKA